MNFADDLDAIARLGWGPDTIDRLSRIGFNEGDLATFVAAEPDMRHLILRLLYHPTDEDHAELASHPAARSLSQWLLTLPAYRNAPDDGEESKP